VGGIRISNQSLILTLSSLPPSLPPSQDTYNCFFGRRHTKRQPAGKEGGKAGGKKRKGGGKGGEASAGGEEEEGVGGGGR